MYNLDYIGPIIACKQPKNSAFGIHHCWYGLKIYLYSCTNALSANIKG